MPSVPALVTLHVWQVPTAGIGRALGHLAGDRLALRRTRGLLFSKSLGTGGPSFAATDATPTRWALLATWDSRAAARAFTASPLVRSWDRLAVESGRLDLHPLTAHGRWSRREPFGDPTPAQSWTGPVVVLTRARLRLRKAPTFWRAVPPVSTALAGTPGLRLAFGMGEAPIGVQGTVSLWSDPSAVRRFAYGGAAHVEAVRRTPVEAWYAESLFARFALERGVGSIEGIDLSAAAGGDPGGAVTAVGATAAS